MCTMPGRKPKKTNLSVPELSEEYSSQIISWREDEKVVELHLQYSEKNTSDDEFRESAPMKCSDDKKKKLDKRNIDHEFDTAVMIIQESGAMKKETDTENPAANELNYDNPSSFQPETIQQEEVHMNRQEKAKLNKKTRKPKNQVLLLHQCPECPYNTKHKDHLNRHSVKHKKRDKLDWYSCPECPYTNSRKDNLKAHAEIHNKLILKCLKCSYTTLRARNLKRHQRISHSTNIRWVYCPECSFKSRYLSDIKTHIMTHKDDSFKCPNCSYQTRRKDSLAKHQLRVHENMDKWHSCPLCPYKTYFKTTLRIHCRRIHNTNPDNPNKIEIFTGTDCSYESGCKKDLKMPHLVYDPSHWFQCSNCAYKTPCKSSLKNHVLRHQGENAEGWRKCPKCPYKAVTEFLLRYHHLMKHTSSEEIKWFECSQCNYKTVLIGNLRRHQLQHKEAHEVE